MRRWQALLLVLLVLVTGGAGAALWWLYQPLALARDTIRPKLVDRAAIILTLADEIEARCPHGRPIAVDCRVGRSVTVSVPLLPSWLARDLDKRFERAFGRPLILRH